MVKNVLQSTFVIFMLNFDKSLSDFRDTFKTWKTIPSAEFFYEICENFLGMSKIEQINYSFFNSLFHSPPWRGLLARADLRGVRKVRLTVGDLRRELLDLRRERRDAALAFADCAAPVSQIFFHIKSVFPTTLEHRDLIRTLLKSLKFCLKIW